MINDMPVILSSKVTIGEAIAQIAKITNNSQRYAVVIDHDFTGSILGILTETVILQAIATVPNWQNQAIADITPPHKLILNRIPPDPVAILNLLQAEQVSHLIVIDSEKHPVGVINETDLLKHIWANPPAQMHQISQKIIAVEKQNLKLEAQISDRTKSLRHINQELLAEISERKLATVALRESEDKFRHIFEDSPMGISLLSLDGKYSQVNPAYCQMLGYTESELKKLSVFEITHSHNISLEKDLMGKIEKGAINQYHLEKSYIKKDQQTLRANQTAATIRDSLGNVRYFINMVEDISDRTKAAEDLRQSEERFRKIFEESPIGMAILGLDQKVIKINAVLSQMFGYSEIELISQSLSFLTHSQDQPASDRLAQYLYRGQLSSYQLEKRCIRKNQQIIWVSLNASVVKDQDGQILHVLIMIRDITKQKASQELITNSLAEKEILLQEVHHRVKNNLHVIASLLELQARSTDDEHIINLFTDSQNRIHSMALIHEQLCLSPKFEHIDFEQYLRKLIGNLFSSYGVNPIQIKCIFDVEPVNIRFQTAIPCGLILNEIVSNSLKYAFQGRNGGEIRIQLHQQNDCLNLVISDQGYFILNNTLSVLRLKPALR